MRSLIARESQRLDRKCIICVPYSSDLVPTDPKQEGQSPEFVGSQLYFNRIELCSCNRDKFVSCALLSPIFVGMWEKAVYKNRAGGAHTVEIIFTFQPTTTRTYVAYRLGRLEYWGVK